MNTATTLRPRPTAVATATCALLLVAVAACGSSSSTSTDTGGGGGGAAVTVNAKNIAFDPTSVSVAPNTQVTITFDNQDSVLHSLTFDDSSKSVDANAGETQTLVFTTGAAGTTIAFHCKYHASMHGRITVGGSAGAAPTTSSSSSGAYYGG
ncbi:MAG TPA: cupredoxin domain-containing protein [Candidatus Dormibacteraeota bacterium]|nr:cupredoxin domain-containing protein [Candidatus Dormibacteraeota bacterium]